MKTTAIPAIVFVVGLALTFAAQALASRVLGIRSFGQFSAAYNLTTILSGVGAIGLDLASLRFATLYFEKGAFKQLSAFSRLSVFLALAAAGLCSLPLFVVGLNSVGAEGELLIIAACAIPLWAGTRVLSGVLRGMNMPAWALAPDRILRDGALCAILAAFLLAHLGRFTAAYAMWAIFGGCAVGFALSCARVVTALPDSRGELSSEETKHRDWVIAAIGLWAVNGLELTFSRTEVLSLAAFGRSLEVGQMSILLTLSSLVFIPSLALNVVMLPRLSSVFDSGDRSALIKVSNEFSYVGTALSLLVGLPILIFPHATLSLFGHGAESAVTTLGLRIMIAARLIVVPFMPSSALMMMSGKQDKLILPYVIALIIKTTILFLVIPIFGLIGAVIVSALVSVVLIAWFVAVVRHHLGFLVANPRAMVLQPA